MSWYVGERESDAAMIFMDDLAKRLASRAQLTSDGYKAYLAVEGPFGFIDYVMLVKVYGPAAGRPTAALKPGKVHRRGPSLALKANPIRSVHVSTSYAER